MGVIDVEAPSALLAVSGADIVLLAVPVAATEATFKAIKHLVTPQMLIMDVGSTKRDVVDAARRACANRSARLCRRTRSPARKCPAWNTPTPTCTAASRSSSRRSSAP
jgi:predicted dinucleotide-binding enzyme